ncbi:hypothetical protein ACFO25_19150 [Paenactinomyces guangxiensis]|uniref:Uncharacterized protein n=1 Tax=Paenactinomyces guangxiensis TaxID=1490290 RepID=A0A7W1WSU2_9BACL|nr:hypothetical protein [Paenactinomyces guangxiensis]MBA4495430.1 hypothetical protein [Paenactinomyces guangxiensis]MBH8592449.1 hypothetical protein [Paenactinomyces guangxiensis]
MSFFRVGESYRDSYQIEHVVPFFDGELAIARFDSKRYYLQTVHLQKQAPARAIQQYRSLSHPLVIPFMEVYTEDRSLVFIRPYLPIHPLREVISARQADEDQIVEWGKQLLQLEAELKSMPIPMYLLLDPRSVGVTDSGELKVLFCGLEQITVLQPTLDWGTFFYSLLSGHYLEEPIAKLPDNLPVSKPMARLLQKSLGNRSINSVRSQIETYEKKKHGKGLFGRLFRGEKKDSAQHGGKTGADHHSSISPPVKDPISSPPSSSDVRLSQTAKHMLLLEEQRKEFERREQERLEQMRQEFERRQQELLEKQRQELERRQQELLEKQRLEFEQKQKELLMQKAELERLKGEEQQRERREQERLERERREQERLEQERLKREQQEQARKEMERLKQERLAWEQQERKRLGRIRQEFEQKEQELKAKLQQEFEEREQRLLAKQAQEYERQQQELLEQQRRLEKEKLELERRRQAKANQPYPKQSLLTNPDSIGPSLLEPENTGKQRTEEEHISKEQEERQRLLKERLERESEEHAQLAKQFEEYMKQMLNKK